MFHLAGPGQVARKVMDYPSTKVALAALAFDRSARTLAIVSLYAPEPRQQRVHLIDLANLSARSFPQSTQGSGSGFAGQTRAVAFSWDDQLLTAGEGGLRQWDLVTGSSRTLAGGEGSFATFAIGASGRRLVAVLGRNFDNLQTITDSELRLLDLTTQEQSAIPAHGDQLTLALATDPAVEIVVTGDASGVVRVGPVRGGEPHLLPGHAGAVLRVAVSPDRRWIASASGAEVRLWPMPDLARPPFHTLEHAELLARLRSLTNLEVVADPAAATGYRVAIGPFQGWKDVPRW